MTYFQSLPFELQQEITLYCSDPWQSYYFQQIFFHKLTSNKKYWKFFCNRFIGGNHDTVINHEYISIILTRTLEIPEQSWIWAAIHNAHILVSYLDKNYLKEVSLLESCFTEAAFNNSVEYIRCLTKFCTLPNEDQYITFASLLIAGLHCNDPLYSHLKQINIREHPVSNYRAVVNAVHKYVQSYGTKDSALTLLIVIYHILYGRNVLHYGIFPMTTNENETLLKMIDRRHIDYIFKHYGLNCKENIVTLLNIGMNKNLLTTEQLKLLEI